MALSVLPDVLRGCLLTWYIDNTSAAACAIKGASPDEDSSPLALVGCLLAAHLGIALWVEHVGSTQNPADVMTHDAFSDPSVCEGIAAGTVAAIQPTVAWTDLTSLSAAHALILRWVANP